MKPKLYIENSIVSYLTAEPSVNIITAARQALTRQWWNEKRFDYQLYISEFVISEARAGDPLMATRRLEVLERKCRLAGYNPPIICTPEELLGE